MVETFYEVLSVSPDASEAVITDAYREAVKETHPDVSDAPDAEDEFVRLTRAKEVLTDPEKRAAYDHLGHERYVDRVVHGPLDPASVSTDSSEPTRSTTGPNEATETAGGARSGTDRASGHAGAGGRDTTAGSTTETKNGATGATAATTGTATAGSEATTEQTASSDRRTETAERVGWRERARRRREQTEADGYATRTTYSAETVDAVRVPLTTESLILVGAMFLLYPVFVFVSIYPLFPLFVNVVLGLCTLTVVGYLLSMPPVAFAVFGAWGLLGPLVILLADGLSVVSPIGLVVLVATWVPFSLAALTRAALRR